MLLTLIKRMANERKEGGKKRKEGETKMKLLIEERRCVSRTTERMLVQTRWSAFLIHHLTVYASVCFQCDLFRRSGPFEFGQSVKPFDCV